MAGETVIAFAYHWRMHNNCWCLQHQRFTEYASPALEAVQLWSTGVLRLLWICYLLVYLGYSESVVRRCTEVTLNLNFLVARDLIKAWRIKTTYMVNNSHQIGLLMQSQALSNLAWYCGLVAHCKQPYPCQSPSSAVQPLSDVQDNNSYRKPCCLCTVYVLWPNVYKRSKQAVMFSFPAYTVQVSAWRCDSMTASRWRP
jgi:hypothetical protein